jgi:ubiquinol-cytochrome c reductase cytochrome b subunit
MFVGYHLMLVIRNGISEPAKVGRLVDPKTYRAWYKQMLVEKGIPFWPYAAWRDVIFGALTIISIILLAVFIGPPALTGPPNPASINANPSPDWYMLSIFSLFALMPPKIESYMIIIGPALTILILLALPFVSNKGERHPLRRPWAIFGAVCVIVFVFSLFLLGERSPWSPKFDAKPLTVTNVHSTDTLVVKGAALFFKKGCLYCHRINDQGGFKGPELSDVALRLSTADLKIRIVNGGSNMPAYGGILDKKELTAILTFLKSRNTK